MPCPAQSASPAALAPPRRRWRATRRITGAAGVLALGTALLVSAATGALADPYGPDVANYQHPNNAPIVWSKVAAEPDQHFAIIKATESTNYVNPYRASDGAQAAAAGLTVGYYHFADPGVSATAQADFFARTIGHVGANELPPILDLEVTGVCGTKACSAAQIVSWTKTFLTRVRADTGRTPMIYTDPGFWNADVHSSAFSAYPLWLADYTFNPFTAPSEMPEGWTSYALWQYTDNASIPGIQGETDRSTAASAAELARLADANPNAYYLAALAQKVLNHPLALATNALELRALDRGDLTRMQVAAGMVTGPAYLTTTVGALYRQTLHQAATAAETAALVAAMRRGLTLEQALASLTASTEFYNQAGGTPTGFLTAAYTDLTGAAPSRSRLEVDLASLRRGVSRASITAAIVTGPASVAFEGAKAWSFVFATTPSARSQAVMASVMPKLGRSLLRYEAWLFSSALFLNQAEHPATTSTTTAAASTAGTAAAPAHPVASPAPAGTSPASASPSASSAPGPAGSTSPPAAPATGSPSTIPTAAGTSAIAAATS